MIEPKIKEGELVVYMDGLFRVNEIREETDATDNVYLHVRLGDLWVTSNMFRKADWRDVARITKGGNHD